MKTLRIALLGHRLDSSNLGVDALARAHLNLLAETASAVGVEIDATIFTWTRLPEVTFAPGLRVRQEVLVLEPRDFLGDRQRGAARFRDFDYCFDLSEGDSFSDIYGGLRAYQRTWDKLLVLRSGVPLTLSPMTIGPFDQPVWRRIAAQVVRGAAAVFARDGQSHEFAHRLGRDDATLASDLAFLLPYQTSRREETGKLKVGLNVSQLLWSGGYDRSNQFSLRVDYPALVRALVEQLQAMPNVELHFVPHVLATDFPVEDDQLASRELHAAVPGSVLAPPFQDSIAAKSYIATLDFFIGSRMHACIAAFSSGVPVIPLAYSRKFHGVFFSLGYDHTVDLRDTTVERALTLVARGVDNRERLQRQVIVGTAQARDRLQCYADHVRRVLMNGDG